jgi:diguanylate cyclase (GGDEF)-like protein
VTPAPPEAQRLDSAAQRLLKSGRPRRRLSFGDRERAVEAFVAVAVVGATCTLVAVFPPSGFGWIWTAVALTLGFALLYRIEYHVGAVYTAPTELLFVPMLLLVPPPVVPALLVAAFVGATLPEYLSGRTHPERALLDVGNAAYALGPVLVLSIAGAGQADWGDWPIYLLVLAAQFAFDLGASAIRVWGSGSALRPHLRMFAWIYGVDALLAPMGLLAAFASQDQPYAFLLALPFAWIFSFFTREREAHIDKASELSRAYRGTARLLAEVLEDANEYTGAHSRDVVTLAVAVAQRMELDEERVGEAELTALLHDVGKITIPPHVLDKPGALSHEEWALMKTHVVEGQRMLDQVGGPLSPIGRFVRASHERWDGGGYPDGLAGEAIPLPARIVGCCDAYDAMTSGRPYRAALPRPEALAELRRCAGTQFDPHVVETFAAVLEGRGAGTEERLARPARQPATSGPAPASLEHPSLSVELASNADRIAVVAEATRELALAADRAAARGAICEAAIRVSAATAAALLEPVETGRLRETMRAGDVPVSPPEEDSPMSPKDHSERLFLPDARGHAATPGAFIEAAGGVSCHLEPVLRGGALLAVVALTWSERLERLPEPVAAIMGLLAAEAALALERTDLLARVHATTRTDELTGLLKLEAWRDELAREMIRASREQQPLCVALLDVDHLKRFNAANGRPAGDGLLRESAVAWRAELRLTDQLARYGGDEFIALMSGCTVESARDVMERLSSATRAGLSCTSGIAAWDRSEGPDALVERARAALLEAKRRGRNQIAMAG